MRKKRNFLPIEGVAEELSQELSRLTRGKTYYSIDMEMSPEGLKVLAAMPQYFSALEDFRKSLTQNLKDGNVDGIGDTSTKIAEETLDFISNIDDSLGYAAEVAYISQAAREIIENSNILQNSEIKRLDLLDDFDKLHLQVARLKATIDLIDAVISLMSDQIMSKKLGKATRRISIWVNGLRVAKDIIADGIKQVYKNDLQRTYPRFLFNYERNQIAIEGLSKFLDKSAEEVGEYLIKARSDVVTRQTDGKIAVMTDKVLSPP